MTGSSDTGSRAALEPHDERDRAEEDRREDEKLPPPDPTPSTSAITAPSPCSSRWYCSIQSRTRSTRSRWRALHASLERGVLVDDQGQRVEVLQPGGAVLEYRACWWWLVVGGFSRVPGPGPARRDCGLRNSFDFSTRRSRGRRHRAGRSMPSSHEHQR